MAEDQTKPQDPILAQGIDANSRRRGMLAGQPAKTKFSWSAAGARYSRSARIAPITTAAC